MKAYLDASVLVALFIQEAGTPIARAAIAGRELLLSEFAGSEFCAAVTRLVRLGVLSADQAAAVFADFDLWKARSVETIAVENADFAAATAFVRRLDLGLRAPDALHLAVCDRLRSELLTFDIKMAAAAKAIGIVTGP